MGRWPPPPTPLEAAAVCPHPWASVGCVYPTRPVVLVLADGVDGQCRRCCCAIRRRDRQTGYLTCHQPPLALPHTPYRQSRAVATACSSAASTMASVTRHWLTHLRPCCALVGGWGSPLRRFPAALFVCVAVIGGRGRGLDHHRPGACWLGCVPEEHRGRGLEPGRPRESSHRPRRRSPLRPCTRSKPLQEGTRRRVTTTRHSSPLSHAPLPPCSPRSVLSPRTPPFANRFRLLPPVYAPGRDQQMEVAITVARPRSTSDYPRPGWIEKIAVGGKGSEADGVRAAERVNPGLVSAALQLGMGRGERRSLRVPRRQAGRRAGQWQRGRGKSSGKGWREKEREREAHGQRRMPTLWLPGAGGCPLARGDEFLSVNLAFCPFLLLFCPFATFETIRFWSLCRTGGDRVGLDMGGAERSTCTTSW